MRIVTPAKAGVQNMVYPKSMDSRLRGNDSMSGCITLLSLRGATSLRSVQALVTRQSPPELQWEIASLRSQ